MLSNYGFWGWTGHAKLTCLLEKKDALMASRAEHAHSIGLDTDLVRDSWYSQSDASARRDGDSK